MSHTRFLYHIVFRNESGAEAESQITAFEDHRADHEKLPRWDDTIGDEDEN